PTPARVPSAHSPPAALPTCTAKYRYYSTLAACNDAANTYASPGGTSAGDKTVTAGVVPNSDDATFNSAGTFYWRAWYSGDSNNREPPGARPERARGRRRVAR